MNKPSLLLLLTALVPWGCGGGASVDPADDGSHSHDGTTHTHADEEASISVTLWTDDVELFMEHPVLRVGHEAKFAVHLTKLDDFQPLAEGPVLFQFVKAGATPKIVTVGSPQPAGIFGPALTFEEAGQYTLRLEIASDQLETRLEYGPITVLGEGESPPTVEETSGAQTIAFLKEQQWKLPFASASARLRSIHETISVPAEVKPKAGTDSVVSAVAQGTYLPPGPGVPNLGADVRKGDLLGYVEPPPSDSSSVLNSQMSAGLSMSRLAGEVAAAEAAVASEAARLELAEKEAARIATLVEAEALPQRRLDEIRTELEIRRASLQAAERGLLHYREAVSRHQAADRALGSIQANLPLRASVSGRLVEIHAVPGQQVQGGETLFRIINPSKVWVEGKVFENDLPRLDDLLGGALRVAGLEDVELPASSLVLIGSAIDPRARTLPVVFEVENRDRRIKLGALGRMNLVTGRLVETLAVPKSAVLLEENRSVVYVQRGGETFERRPVKTGLEDGEFVQIIEGLNQGERIVTDGAYDVALAARSTEVPEHGHVH